jgi:hypothetical protein
MGNAAMALPLCLRRIMGTSELVVGYGGIVSFAGASFVVFCRLGDSTIRFC